MKTVWNQKRMIELLNSFYTISKIRVGFFSKAGVELVAYPKEVTFYCKEIRSCASGYAACMECDRKAYQHASHQKQFYMYQCHAGLTEIIAPIQNHGEILGYLMMGQFRSSQAGEMDTRKEYLHSLGLDSEKMEKFYEELQLLDRDFIEAYTQILQACAVYVWMDNYITVQESSLGKRVESYVINHLDQKITLPDLMTVFDVGKTTLCGAVKTEFGITVSELIRSIRVGEAKMLLRTTDIPITEIAYRVGMEDYNYFTKIFKQEMGCPPSVYRKNIIK